MLTLAFLLLVAFAGVEMNLIALAIVAFVDIIILGVLNSIFGNGSSNDSELTDYEP